jgi:hypothetical protein
MEAMGATVKVLYPMYRRSLDIAQKPGYDWFPLVANGWETKHPILEKVPPLLAEEEGPLT